MRHFKQSLQVLAGFAILTFLLQSCSGVPIFALTFGVVLHKMAWIINYPSAPHDLALVDLRLVDGTQLSYEVKRDFSSGGITTPQLLQIRFTSRVDLEALTHRKGYRSQVGLGPCRDGTPDPDNVGDPSVYDIGGAINSEAEWYSVAPPGSAHEMIAHPRPTTSGPPDLAGRYIYRIYVPLRDGKLVGNDGRSISPTDICFFVEDFQKFFSGYRSNTVVIPQAKLFAALRFPMR